MNKSELDEYQNNVSLVLNYVGTAIARDFYGRRIALHNVVISNEYYRDKKEFLVLNDLMLNRIDLAIEEDKSRRRQQQPGNCSF